MAHELNRVCPVCGESLGDALQGTCSRCGTYIVVNRVTGQPVVHAPGSNLAGAVITMFAGALMILGAFLPWMSAQAAFFSINRNSFQLGNQSGFSPDGVFLLVLGIVTILIGVSRSMRTALPAYIQRSPIITGIGAVVVALARVGSINHLVQQVRTASSLASASIGFGLWLTIVAGVVAVVGGLALRSSAPAARLAASLSTEPEESVPGGAASSTSAAEPVVPVAAQLHRECPHCKESMRCDASVCPHCRRESPAWRYSDGQWWPPPPDGTQVQLEEDQP
jgi:uncharacterized paraquat-inducible protein A